MGQGRFQYGDLVRYHISTDELTGLVTYAEGRIVGLVTPSSLLTGNMYIFSPWESQTRDAWEVLRLFGQFGRQHEHADVDLVWGDIPEGCWLFVDEFEVSHSLSKKDMDSLKRMGLCSRCGDKGYWKGMVLFCPWHGRIMG